MYTGIFPFKRDGTYWAAIDSPAHKRVLAFGSFDNLKRFLKKGEFQNGTLINFRPYTLIQLKYDDALFAGKKQSLFGFAEKGQQPTSLPDYPSGLLDNFRDGQPLSEEEFRQCRFYMGFDKAQAIANGLEARLQRKFSDEEMRTIIATLGSIPVKNELKNGNGHEKHNGAYGILPNMADMYARLATLPNRAINDLVNAYLMGLAENGAMPNNGKPYKGTIDYISRPFIRFIVDDLSNNGATQMPKNGIMHENTLTQHSTTSNSYHSLLAILGAIAVYSAIFRRNMEKGPDNESDILDEFDSPQPDEIKVPVKHANGLDAIARMAEKLTGRIGIDLSQKPFG